MKTQNKVSLGNINGILLIRSMRETIKPRIEIAIIPPGRDSSFVFLGDFRLFFMGVIGGRGL